MIPSREPLLQPSKRKSARFIDRKGTDERSNGLLLVVRLLLLGTFNISKTGYLKSDAYKDDWFHSFASLSTTTVILSILFAVWLVILVYVVVHGLNSFLGSFVLHLPRQRFCGYSLLFERRNYQFGDNYNCGIHCY